MGKSIHWCVADINNIPFKSDYFDGAICFGVTQALDDSARTVSNLSRVIKPGSHICIDALNSYCLPHLCEQLSRWIRNKPIHLRYETVTNLRNLMKENGFINVRLHWLPILPARWYRYQWIVETHFFKWLFRYLPFFGQLFSHAFIITGQRLQDLH